MSTTTWMYGKFEGFPLKFVKIVWVEEFIMTHDPCCWVPWLVFGGFSRFGATPFLQWGPRSSVFHGTVVLPCRLGGFAVGETQRKNGIRWVIGCIYIYRIYLYTYKNVIWSDWGEIVCAKKLWKNIIPILMKTWRLDRILVFWWCHTRCLRTRFQQELMQKIGNRWCIWAVSKAFGYLQYLGVIIQPSYIGIIISHDKDLYEPLSIMECHIADFGLLGDDATSAIRSSRQSARDFLLETKMRRIYTVYNILYLYTTPVYLQQVYGHTPLHTHTHIMHVHLHMPCVVSMFHAFNAVSGAPPPLRVPCRRRRIKAFSLEVCSWIAGA